MKTILKITGVCTIATLMFCNVQLFESKVDNNISLVKLEVLANANAETDDEFYDETGCRATWENVICRGNSYSYDARP